MIYKIDRVVEGMREIEKGEGGGENSLILKGKIWFQLQWESDMWHILVVKLV